MQDIKAKQQVVEKIKSSANILVTVSKNPTVDALSAAIGLTLLFEKLGKYGTAVFSGVVPPAIAFLEPQKVLDETTDSLRDFIIALDKEKADHLSYKLVDDIVRISITPYKTTITSDDLKFSQGDYNVELVIALGVDDQDHLDKALEAHGQIFHDATVVTVTANDQTSSLGGIDWHDEKASSLSEMVTGLAELLKTDKNKTLIDSQIATAFMTGLVAQTERFSNRYTSPQSLTVASGLMAAGADQQLIATKLQEAVEEEAVVEETPAEEPIEETIEETPKEDDGTLRILDHSAKKKEVEEEPEPVVSDPVEEPTPEPEPQETVEEEDDDTPADNFSVSHETLEELDHRVKEEEQKEAAEAAHDALEHVQQQEEIVLPPVDEPVIEPEAPKEGIDALIVDDAVAPTPRDPIVEEASESVQLPPPVQPATQETSIEPSMGGTLNATTEQAADDARREEESDRNRTILSHGGNEQEAAAAVSAPAMDPALMQAPSLVPPTPIDLGLPLPPPIPDFSAPPANPVMGAYAPQPQPEILGDILAPEPQATTSQYFTPPVAEAAPSYFPPVDSQQLPPLPPMGPPPMAPPAPDNPGQFKIPGQQ